MRRLMLLSSLMVVLLLIVACAPTVSDEQLEKDLSKLSPEEQSALLKQSQSDSAAAGNAIASRYGASDRTQLVRVLSRMRAAQSVKDNKPVDLKQADLMIVSSDAFLLLNKSSGMNDVNYTVTIKNVGSDNAAGFNVHFKSLFPNLGVPAVSIDQFVAKLDAGMSVTLWGVYSPYFLTNNGTKTACPGVHNLNITVDTANQVAESNEDNNWFPLSVTC